MVEVMSQTKTQSAIETVTSVAIGYTVALVGQIVIFPLFGIHNKLSDNMMIAGLFTILSLIRTYFVRRLFNRWHR